MRPLGGFRGRTSTITSTPTARNRMTTDGDPICKPRPGHRPVPNRKIAPYVQVMSIENKRGEGAAEELGGTIKKVAGKVLGNEQMEAEGRAKEAAGEAKQEAAKAAGRAEGKIEEVAGAVKNRIGQVIDNEQMAAEGKAKEIKGEAKQKANE